ncbi:MAG: 1,4-dihydroxy-6-naphthoate synthase [Syntrophaceae bacterium]
MNVDIAFSPCPNDTFIFHALIHGCIDAAPFRFTPHIADVEELNTLAFTGTSAVTKLSFYAYLLLKDRYELLDAGSALGYGCGPLLVAGKPLKSIQDTHIAVPGRYTTAYLLLQLWQGRCNHVEFTRFDQILPGIAGGMYDAGIIIHEGRFVYPTYNCIKIIDLGEWWEKETGLPIPLGCIAIRRDMLQYKDAVESLLRASVGHAMNNPAASREFIKSHAQELDDQVISEHISLYVNDFTLSLGETGRRAVQTLEERARCRAIL